VGTFDIERSFNIRIGVDGIEGKEISDEELMRRFQGGDRAAFTSLVKRFQDPLYYFICRFIGDPHTAEDILQETFLRVYLKRNRYREIARFSTWIYTIAVNLAKSEFRRRKRVRSFDPNEPGRGGIGPVTVGEEGIEEEADRYFRNRLIQEKLSQLPPKFRLVVILRDIQQLSYEEISGIVGVPVGTVKSRINRGRIRLYRMLKSIL